MEKYIPNQNVPVTQSPQAMKVLQEISNAKGKLDLQGMKPFLINMGGKPYIDKGGLELKLQEVANKRQGIKSILTIIGSYAHEDPKQMLELAVKLPREVVDAMCKERDYMAEMFTAPQGTAVAKCIIIFGDGMKVSAKATANKDNVQMSTIHAHLDVMAQTRAFNRCVRYITANGFLDVNNMIQEEIAVDETAFEDDDEDVSFREYDNGIGNETNSGEYIGTEGLAEAESGEPILSGTGEDEEAVRGTEPATQKQKGAIHILMNELGYTKEQIQGFIKEKYGKTSSKELTKNEASDLISFLKNKQKEFFAGTPFEEVE